MHFPFSHIKKNTDLYKQMYNISCFTVTFCKNPSYTEEVVQSETVMSLIRHLHLIFVLKSSSAKGGQRTKTESDNWETQC